MTILEFLRAEDGLVTVDWVVLLGGLTFVGMSMFAVIGDAMSEEVRDVRGELQDAHFDTTWFDNVAVLPPSMQ